MELYEYQEKIVREAALVLEEHNVVCLSLMMRLGKTFIALKLCRGKRILFVTRKKAMESILSDASKIGVEITCVNYESLHKVSILGWDTIIVDECHAISSYPKPSKRTLLLASIFAENKDCYAILLSGTFSVESMSQHFHIIRTTGKFWTEYRNFYAWFKDFGIPSSIRIRGRTVNQYDKTKGVLEAIEHLFVVLSQKDAGFAVEAEIMPKIIENEAIMDVCSSFMKDCVFYFDGYAVVGESSASILSKCLQFCGETIIGDDGEAHILNYGRSKLGFIESLVENKICIFTNFIKERELILNSLSNATEDMNSFKFGSFKYFVGSLKQYSEGFDLSEVKDCALVLYSLCWSGASFVQICARQQNKNRVEPINIYCPLIKGTPEEGLFKAVSNKKNFNVGFYKSLK